MTELDIQPISGLLGAEVRGLDADQIDEGVAAQLRKALNDHLVLALPGLDPSLRGFRDIAALAPHCRYPDCSHTHEPECMVQVALLEGALAPFRFDSYLKILESLDEQGG